MTSGGATLLAADVTKAASLPRVAAATGGMRPTGASFPGTTPDLGAGCGTLGPEAGAGGGRRAQNRWIRPSGQIRRNAWPTMSLAGTGPQYRESSELPRLSPIM